MKQPQPEPSQSTFVDPVEPLWVINLGLMSERFPSDAELLTERPDRAFIESVKTFGVLEPILVKAVDEWHYDVIDGRKRLIAWRQARSDWEADNAKGTAFYPEPRKAIDCREYNVTENQEALLTLVANEQRTRNILSDLRAIKILTLAGMSEETIRKETGMSNSTFKQRIHLFKLRPALLEALFKKQIKTNVALAVAKLSGDLQQACEEHFKATGTLTLADVAEIRSAHIQAGLRGMVVDTLLFGDFEEGPELSTALESAGEWIDRATRLVADLKAIIPASEVRLAAYVRAMWMEPRVQKHYQVIVDQMVEEAEQKMFAEREQVDV